MPTVSPGDLALQRGQAHKSDVYVSFLIPPILWKVRLDDGAIVKGETAIDFDTGTGSYFGLIGELQEIWVGTSDGEKDVGRLRIRSITSGDAGVTGTVTVAGHSLPLQDDLYLTFLHHYPLRPRYSYLDYDTDSWYMDLIYAYVDQHEEPPPVVVAGPHRAGFLDSTPEFVINVDASDSYPIASGATISSYALSVVSTAGTPTVNFNTGTGLGDITFTLPGYYWAKYTVTDSNGKEQDSYRCYFVHEDDRSSQWYPFVDFETLEIGGDWEGGGWLANMGAKDNYSFDDIPEHTLAVIWRRSWYGDIEKNITYLPDECSTIFTGYARDEMEEQDYAVGTGNLDLTLGTVEGKLRRIYSFSASIVAQRYSIDDWFGGPNWMTVGVIAHFLLRWRSTLFEVADVIGLDTNTLRRPGFEPDDSNLYDMVNTFTLDEGIRAKLVCDQGGRVHLTYDIQLLTDSERGALSTVFDIKKDPDAGDYGGSLTIPRQPENEVPFVTSDGVYWDGTDWDVDDRPEPTGDWCVIAPGGVGLEEGPEPKDFPRQTVSSLQHLKEIAGRFLAKTNNHIEEVRIDFAGDYLGVLDIAYDDAVWTISLQASDTPRGKAWTDKPLYCRNIVARFRGDEGTFSVSASFEVEADGIDGEETECPVFPLLGGEVPIIPLPAQQPGALITGSSAHFKSVSGNSWDKRISQDVLDLRADPYWRGKQGTTSPSSAILFRCGVGYIKRTTDAFDTTDVDVTPGNDPPNDAGDSPAPTASTVTYSQIGPSWIDQDRFLFLVRWQETGGDWRSWICITTDNGSTYSWKYLGDAQLCSEKGTKSSAFSTGYWDGSSSPHVLNTHRGNPILNVGPDTYVITYRDASENNVYVRAFTMSGDDITWGSAVDVDACPSTGGENGLMILISSGKFAIVYQGPGGIGELCRPAIKIGTVTGSAISLGSKQEVLTDYESAVFMGADWEVGTGIAITSPNSGRIVVFKFGKIMEDWLEEYCAESSDWGCWVMWGDISGTDITWEECPDAGAECPDGCGSISQKDVGKWRSVERGLGFGNGSQAIGIPFSTYALFAYIRNGAIKVFTVADTDDTVEGLTTAVSSGSLSVEWTIFKLTSTKAVLAWQEWTGSIYLLKAKVITVTGATPTVGATNTLRTSAGATDWIDDLYGAALTTDYAVLSYTIYDGDCQSNMLLDISGDTITVDEVCDEMNEYAAGVGGQTITKYMLMGWDSATANGVMWTGITANDLAECNPPLESYPLGLALGKSVGNKVWVTHASGLGAGSLELLEIALPGLTITDRFDLGAATIAEVLAKTRVAYPFVPFGYDDVVYVFGNMDDPQSLGDPAHVIRTVNGGSAFTLIENGWGADHCGSLVVTTGNYMYAIRNRGAQPKLYRDEADNNLLVRLTLPFMADVVHHGILVDYRTADVYACANAADPIMVVKVPPPWLIARDITYDHEVIEGIWSIVGL